MVSQSTATYQAGTLILLLSGGKGVCRQPGTGTGNGGTMTLICMLLKAVVARETYTLINMMYMRSAKLSLHQCGLTLLLGHNCLLINAVESDTLTEVQQ
jgi:hypothetical protein